MKSSSVSNSKVAAQVRLTEATASDKKRRRGTKPLVDAISSPQKKKVRGVRNQKSPHEQIKA